MDGEVATLELGKIIGVVKDGKFVGVELLLGESVKGEDGAAFVLDTMRQSLDRAGWVSRQVSRKR